MPATRKKVGKGQTRVIVETPETDALDPDNPAPAAKPEDEDVEEVLSALPQEARVELWKWGLPEADEWNYVGRHPVHGFSLDSVARDHGSGKYRMIVRGPKVGDDGRTRVTQLHRRHFAVGGAAKQGGGGGTDGIGMGEMLRINMEMLRTMAMAPRENMADLVRAIHEMSAPKTDPLAMAVQLVTLLKQDKSSFNDMMEVLRTGMEIAEGKGDSGVSDFARVFAEMVGKMPSGPQPRQVQPQQPQPKQTAAGTKSDAQKFFEIAAATLRRPSENDGDIDLYADWICDQIEPVTELHPYLNNWFIEKEYPDQVIPLFPGVQTAWLRAVLIRVRDILTGAEEAIQHAKGSGGDSGGGSGDEPDSGGNEGTSQPEPSRSEGASASNLVH